MPTLTEGKLHFDFPSGWQVVKYDAEGGFYRETISKSVQHVRGVDLVASPPDAARLLLIEVKDCRQDTKTEVTLNTVLLETVQRKTLDTLAGLLIAERMQEPSLRVLAKLSRQPVVEVVLLLIEPLLPVAATPTGNKLRRVTRTTGRTDLAQKLTAILASWGLPFKLLGSPTSSQPASATIEGWTVRIDQ